VEGVEIPSEILLPCELPEGEVLAGWLREKGRKVELTVPQRQSKADLLAMVEKNALYELEKTKEAPTRDLQSLQDLAVILDLPALPHRIEGYDILSYSGFPCGGVVSGVYRWGGR
jgi:excinuclease ABC subunit C